MSVLKKYNPFFVAAILLCIILVVIYPYYRYYVDPDAISYLTISKRYATGDFQKAINGYWSPWSCWLTALLITKNIEPFTAAIIINAIGALGFLYISQSLFVLYNIARRMQWMLCSVLSVFLCYAVFKQSFDDLWECFFLLSSLRIMLSPGFERKPLLWLAMGMTGALAYFAKAYSFPFFILNTICCSFFVIKGWEKNKLSKWLLISTVSIGVMLACSFPWIYLLHAKYGSWMTSSAGPLNMSWFLVGHPYFKKDILQLIPPVYADAVSYWEDPWKANGHTPHFWDSAHLFGLQLLKIGYNVLKLLLSMSEISAFILPAGLLCISMAVSKNIRQFFSERIFVPALSFLLFPLGYILVNFEARYIWYMLPLAMLISANAIYRLWPISELNIKRTVTITFLLSFLIWPIYDMAEMYREGEAQYEQAQQLKQMGIKGSYAANTVFGDANYIATQQLAYFSGCRFYPVTSSYVPYGSLLYDLRRYRVKYFFYYYDNVRDDGTYTMKDEHGNAFPEVTGGKISGLKVFLITNQRTKEGFLNAVMGQLKLNAKDKIYIDERACTVYLKGTNVLKRFVPRQSLIEILNNRSMDSGTAIWNNALLYDMECVDSSVTDGGFDEMKKPVNKSLKSSKLPSLVYSISKPVFDNEGNYAVIYVKSNSGHHTEAVNNIYVFRKLAEHWRIKGIGSYINR